MKSTQTDILVIGGGIVGTLLAYFLAKAGRDVLLVEEFDLGTLASGSNAGSLHAQIPHEPFVLEGEAWARGFAPVIPLMVESIGLWQELAKEFAVDLEISLGGGLLVAETEAQMRDVGARQLSSANKGFISIFSMPANSSRSRPISRKG